MKYIVAVLLFIVSLDVQADNGGWWTPHWPYERGQYKTKEDVADYTCSVIDKSIHNVSPVISPYFSGVSYDYTHQIVYCVEGAYWSQVYKDAYFECPEGLIRINEDPPKCQGFYLVSSESNAPSCAGNTEDTISEADPCDPATGKVFLSESDVSSVSTGLSFTRYYQTMRKGSERSIGVNWRHTYVSIIGSSGMERQTKGKSTVFKSNVYATPELACSQGGPDVRAHAYRGLLKNAQISYQKGMCNFAIDGSLKLSLPVYSANEFGWNGGLQAHRDIRIVMASSGHEYTFVLQDGVWGNAEKEAVTLSKEGDDWYFKDKQSNTYHYDDQGKVISKTESTGKATLYSYNNMGLLVGVTGPYGHTLTFNYDELGKLDTLTGPDGVVSYQHDDIGNLVQVTYPDNSTRKYLYEDTNYPHNITGLIDENGHLMASWKYDDKGRVIMNEQAGSTARHDFIYSSEGSTTVTDELGASRKYTFEINNGRIQISNVTGDKCDHCSGGRTKLRAYDSSGYLLNKSDWNGITTTYLRNVTGLELSHTEAAGTTQARTIATEWHPDFRKPVRITKPNSIIEYTYDNDGHVLSKTERAAP
jgi:YD repeat-containing protein